MADSEFDQALADVQRDNREALDALGAEHASGGSGADDHPWCGDASPHDMHSHGARLWCDGAGFGEREAVTLARVQVEVARIASIAADDESAHAAADALYEAVLAAIAGGASDASALAGAALAVEAVQFTRWYA